MALADRTPTRPIHGKDCSVGALLRKLEGEELATLKRWLGTDEDRGWSAADIWATLREEGHIVGLQTINTHRGGKCRCANEAAA